MSVTSAFAFYDFCSKLSKQMALSFILLLCCCCVTAKKNTSCHLWGFFWTFQSF